ncbi:hypothetical protein BG000_011897 [Podila horticola]|nr:hypothetical protein BG000_011897 [Podila horticola]
MTNHRISLFCLVDGLPQPEHFPSTPRSQTLLAISNASSRGIKHPTFNVIAPDQLTLWRVSIQVVPANKHKPIVLNENDSPTQLDPTDDLSDVFSDQTAAQKTIHIIVQRPPPIHAPLPARVPTPLSGYLLDTSRPGAPLSGDLHVDIKKIMDKFFTPGTPITDFLDAFGRGQRELLVTAGLFEICREHGVPDAGNQKRPPAQPTVLGSSRPFDT